MKTNSAAIDPVDQPWASWLSELQTLLGATIKCFDGWADCYAAGLSPEEAIACRDIGAKREDVINYCSASDVRYELRFA